MISLGLATKMILVLTLNTKLPADLKEAQAVRVHAPWPETVVCFPAGSSMKDGSKDGFDSCEITPVEGTDEWAVSASDGASCPFSVPSGVMVKVLSGGSAMISPVKAFILEGQIEVQTATLPFTVENTDHVVDPDRTVAVGIQDSLLLVRSLAGETRILACGAANARCTERQVYYLLEGEMLAIKTDGSWWAYEDRTGKVQYNQSGCSQSASTTDFGTAIGLLAELALLFFGCRRRRKAA